MQKEETVREFKEPVLMGDMIVKRCIDCRADLEIKLPGKEWQKVKQK